MSALPKPAEALPEPAPSGAAPSLVQAMSLARRSVALFTELEVDSVASCELSDGEWRVVVDVVEAKARMGDNDLIASYEVSIGGSGEVTRYVRVGRYRREELARARS